MSDVVRVWRVRKNSTWLDARLAECSDSTEVELQFFRDNSMISARRWPTREAALSHAGDQLRELQVAGWNTHW
jgi:hypothetical protein